MNIVDDPWIPVLCGDGQRQDVSLGDAFRRCHEIKDLVARPVERVSMLRLLLCVSYAALEGPKSQDDWKNCRRRLSEASLDYLKKWHHRFELYGERPFLQVSAGDMKPLGNATLDKLSFDLAAGNNATLFDHGANPKGRSQTDAWTMRNLLAYQSFSPGGKIGESTWGGMKTGSTSTHAPCVEKSMLQTILSGDTLFETLLLNLTDWEGLLTRGVTTIGRPIWELDLDSQSGGEVEEHCNSLLGRLVPRSRAIMIVEGDREMTLAAGHTYPKIPEGIDPMATVKMNAKTGDLHYRAVDLTKQPWRSLEAILTMRDDDQTGGPLCLRNLRQFSGEFFTIWTGGLAADKAKVLDQAEWLLTIPRALLSGPSLKMYRLGVTFADSACQNLWGAAKVYEKALKQKGKASQVVRQVFWATIGRPATAPTAGGSFLSPQVRHEDLAEGGCKVVLGGT